LDIHVTTESMEKTVSSDLVTALESRNPKIKVPPAADAAEKELLKISRILSKSVSAREERIWKFRADFSRLKGRAGALHLLRIWL
jgi:hypothetical protein